MFAVPTAVVLCGVSLYLTGCAEDISTTTTTTTTTRPGAKPLASLSGGSNPKSLLKLQSGVLAVKYAPDDYYPHDSISLWWPSWWEDAVENNHTGFSEAAILALPGTSAGTVASHDMQELHGGILAAGTYTDFFQNSYEIFLFDSRVIKDSMDFLRRNASARASLGVVDPGVTVHALQELQGGHLAVSVSSTSFDDQGKILLFHRKQIEDAIAMNETGVEARASLRVAEGWEADYLGLHALQQLQGGHLAVGVKGGIQLFDHALVEDALANNRTNVEPRASLAAPTSDAHISALEELQDGHLAAGTFAADGIFLFERQMIEDALSNNKTGVQARASLACGSLSGTCSINALQKLQGGHLAAGVFSTGVMLFSNASIANALANDQIGVEANGMLAGDQVVALDELSWNGGNCSWVPCPPTHGNLAAVVGGNEVPVFSHAIIEDALAGNAIDVQVV